MSGDEWTAGVRMGVPEALLEAVEAIHAAGLDADLWTGAVGKVVAVIGGNAGTFEIIDRRTSAHRLFLGFQTPPMAKADYLRHYASVSPRIPGGMRTRPGETFWDYAAIDEREIDRNEFYADFLAPIDMRYVLAGVAHSAPDEFVGVTVQRSRAQGHVQAEQIALMKRLIPHIGHAADTMKRLGQAGVSRAALEDSLDWLADGVALIDHGGRVLHLNQALEDISLEGDGVQVGRRGLILGAPSAQARFAAALDRAWRLLQGDTEAGATDLAAPRPSGAAPYLISVRPLPGARGGQPLVMVMVRDPDRAAPISIELMRDALGFTAAEASLARALHAGMTASQYAQRQGLSLNTVYTHLRRLKEKSASRTLPELLRILNEFQGPLR